MPVPATGRSILIRLMKKFLYCADNGKPIDGDGVKGLMFAHTSSIRRTSEICRFGLGFKSVLGVSDVPEFFSLSGSLRFDGRCTGERGRQVVLAERYPALCLPEPIDLEKEAELDANLQESMGWAANIVRLPLKTDVHGDLAAHIRDFPPEFLLLDPHVRYLSPDTESEESRQFTLREENGQFRLDTGNGVFRWPRFKHFHRLSAEA